MIEKAVSKALKEHEKATGDKIRNAVGPGTHKDVVVDLTLEVGLMTVGEDSDRAPTASIPLLATIGLFAKELRSKLEQEGMDGEEAKSEVFSTTRRILADAFSLNKDAEAELLSELGVSEAMDDFKAEVISSLPRTETKGRVTLKDVSLQVKGIGQKI
jgi:hypothetical protein